MNDRGPLDGIRVIEFGSFIAGPFAGQILADMGADVIKIEPLTGDPWRHQNSFAPGESRGFLPLNRGVRSVCLDLKQPSAHTALNAIVRTADGVVSNNRLDTSKKLGIDYESLSKLNDQLIYVEISGYGPLGSRAKLAGFDLIMQGYSGAIASEGKITDGHPDPVWSSSYIDFSTAYAAAAALMAGLIKRSKSGKGQKASTSLYANAIAMQSMRVVRIDEMSSPAQKWFKENLPQLRSKKATYTEIQESYQKVVRAVDYRCYYRAYQTKDGGIALGTLALHARKKLLDFLEMDDPRLDNPSYDYTTREAQNFSKELVQQFENIFLERTTDEWFNELRSRDIPCEPIRFVEEIPDDDQAISNKYIIELNHPLGFTYRSPGPIIQFMDTNPKYEASPKLGQHTRDVLLAVGFTNSTIDKFIGSNIAGE